MDICNPLCCLLITLLAAIAAYQKGIAPPDTRKSSNNLLLYAIEMGDFLDSVKSDDWLNYFYTILHRQIHSIYQSGMCSMPYLFHLIIIFCDILPLLFGIHQQRFFDLSVFEKRVFFSRLQRTESFVLHRLSCAYGTLHFYRPLQCKADTKN